MPPKRLPNERLSEQRQRLVEQHVKLVDWHVFRKLKGQDPNVVDEAVAECMLGLIRAAQLFDEHRPAERTGKPIHFSTYALIWIKHFFARWLDARLKDQARLPTISMSAIGFREGRTGSWEPEDREQVCDEGGRATEESREELGVLLKYLSAKQASVLRMRYVDGMAMKEIGLVLGVTKQRVNQMLVQARDTLLRRTGRTA